MSGLDPGSTAPLRNHVGQDKPKIDGARVQRMMRDLHAEYLARNEQPPGWNKLNRMIRDYLGTPGAVAEVSADNYLRITYADIVGERAVWNLDHGRRAA